MLISLDIIINRSQVLEHVLNLFHNSIAEYYVGRESLGLRGSR